jgi:hypothetical protein
MMKTGTLMLLAAGGLAFYFWQKSKVIPIKPPATDPTTPWWQTDLNDFFGWLDHHDDGNGGN